MGCSRRDGGAVLSGLSNRAAAGFREGEKLLHSQAVGEVWCHDRTCVNRIEESPHQFSDRPQTTVDSFLGRLIIEHASQATGGARPQAYAESCCVIRSGIA